MEYKKITGSSLDEFNRFLKILIKSNNSVWIRSVIVPGINDNKEYILKLKKYINNIPNIEKIELLPYHLYGVDKYKNLNLDYPLDGVEAMSIEQLKKLEKYLEKK